MKQDTASAAQAQGRGVNREAVSHVVCGDHCAAFIVGDDVCWYAAIDQGPNQWFRRARLPEGVNAKDVRGISSSLYGVTVVLAAGEFLVFEAQRLRWETRGNAFAPAARVR